METRQATTAAAETDVIMNFIKFLPLPRAHPPASGKLKVNNFPRSEPKITENAQLQPAKLPLRFSNPASKSPSSEDVAKVVDY